MYTASPTAAALLSDAEGKNTTQTSLDDANSLVSKEPVTSPAEQYKLDDCNAVIELGKLCLTSM
jgi:hypothetical protein